MGINYRVLETEDDTKRECLIKGKKVKYDGCNSEKLEDAKEFYKKSFEYIGSSNVMYINGVRNEFDEEFHFFKKIKNQN